MKKMDVLFRNAPQGSSSIGTLARAGLFAVMGLIRPLISLGTLALLMVCIALLLFSLTFPPGTHFPTGLVSGMAAGCVAVNFGYGCLMDLVNPTR